MTDSRANPKANSIIGDWEDCDESVNSTLSRNEIKNTIEDENLDNMRRNSFADSNRQKLPWRLEKKKSSSTTSSQASGRTVTKMTPRWKKKTLGYSTKKSCFDKSLTFRTFHGSSKKLMSPRPRLNTTSQKKSKYSWTGRFNSRINKKIPPSENTVDSDNRPESGICSITRTPSPVDNNFYYGNDPDTMERVFHLNNSLKNHQNNLKIQSSGEFQIKESSDDFESKNYAEDSREVNQVRRRFGSRNVNLNLFPEILRDHTTFMNNPNLLMDIDDDRMLPSIKAIGMKEKYNGDFDKAGNGNIYRKVTDFCCAFFANVVLFSFLPIIYIAFFIYIDKGDEQI